MYLVSINLCTPLKAVHNLAGQTLLNIFKTALNGHQKVKKKLNLFENLYFFHMYLKGLCLETLLLSLPSAMLRKTRTFVDL